MWRVLDAARVASSRRCMHGAKPTARQAPAAVAGGARAEISTRLHRFGGLPRAGCGFSCLAGLALALQRRHRQQRAASPGAGVGVRRASTKQTDVRRVSGVRLVRSGWIPA